MSIYDRIGFKGLLNVVWNSTPYHLRLFALPYGLATYHNLLQGSSSLEELLDKHDSKYISSHKFRLFRPKYRKAEEILKEYGIK